MWKSGGGVFATPPAPAKHESRNCSIRFAMTNPSDGYEWSITHFGDFFGALLQIVR